MRQLFSNDRLSPLHRRSGVPVVNLKIVIAEALFAVLNFSTPKQSNLDQAMLQNIVRAFFTFGLAQPASKIYHLLKLTHGGSTTL